MFYSRDGHLDEFCFWRKIIERSHVEYARNSYRDEFINFPPHSYSRVPPRSYSRTLTCTSSHDLSHVSHGPNHCSYDFDSRENNFVPISFGYDPRPHCGDYFPHRPGFSAGGSYTRLEPRHLDDPHFPHHG
jgi:hypothetical protein